MEKFEQKDNQAAIFKNDKKGNDKAPDYRGKGMVNGKEVEMALWVKTSKAGQSYFSVSFKEPYQQPAKGIGNDSENLPF